MKINGRVLECKRYEKTAISNLLHNMLEVPERCSNDCRQTEAKETAESIDTELPTAGNYVTG